MFGMTMPANTETTATVTTGLASVSFFCTYTSLWSMKVLGVLIHCGRLLYGAGHEKNQGTEAHWFLTLTPPCRYLLYIMVVAVVVAVLVVAVVVLVVAVLALVLVVLALVLAVLALVLAVLALVLAVLAAVDSMLEDRVLPISAEVS